MAFQTIDKATAFDSDIIGNTETMAATGTKQASSKTIWTVDNRKAILTIDNRLGDY